MTRVAVLIVVLAALVLGAWFTAGPHSPVFPWLVGLGGFGALGLVGRLPEKVVPRPVRTPGPKSIAVARALGVPVVLGLLDAVGWNRRLGRGRHTVRGRGGLRQVRVAATSSLTSHWCGVVFHAVVAATLAVVGAWPGVIVTLLLGALLHGVPVLMQRYLLARIARVT